MFNVEDKIFMFIMMGMVVFLCESVVFFGEDKVCFVMFVVMV